MVSGYCVIAPFAGVRDGAKPLDRFSVAFGLSVWGCLYQIHRMVTSEFCVG